MFLGTNYYCGKYRSLKVQSNENPGFKPTVNNVSTDSVIITLTELISSKYVPNVVALHLKDPRPNRTCLLVYDSYLLDVNKQWTIQRSLWTLKLQQRNNIKWILKYERNISVPCIHHASNFVLFKKSLLQRWNAYTKFQSSIAGLVQDDMWTSCSMIHVKKSSLSYKALQLYLYFVL